MIFIGHTSEQSNPYRRHVGGTCSLPLNALVALF